MNGNLGATLTELAIRVGPVLVFLVAIPVAAEIADGAGVFDVAGHWAARAGRGRTWLLWLVIVALSCLSTIVLSLDTTAVLLTPVVVAVALQLRLNPLPFAMTTVWLANTASLLLPVSNLTNLLALHRLQALGVSHSGYLRLVPVARPGSHRRHRVSASRHPPARPAGTLRAEGSSRGARPDAAHRGVSGVQLRSARLSPAVSPQPSRRRLRP